MYVSSGGGFGSLVNHATHHPWDTCEDARVTRWAAPSPTYHVWDLFTRLLYPQRSGVLLKKLGRNCVRSPPRLGGLLFGPRHIGHRRLDPPLLESPDLHNMYVPLWDTG